MESIYVTVGRKISKLREVYGLTQQQLAERVGCSVPFMSLIESGKRKASFETYFRIATNGFGIELAELFKEVRAERKFKKLETAGLTRSQKQLLDKFLRSLN